ncbi:helix-turn-helix transcriptional regulator [Lactobacillus sp. DCY120]|uniref:Helix-turn-helix transcriptional regulator n=1 Tax=Bombilactobacillus apium TaxID=2675299 RepID=A0A850R792_9LACO|nr:helix-turn-helix transcriptional regulator [Bombilactobacillus apium]NVY96522.1 helix-turn-helix transcriptional regulator [Bombilactobacillus apium]
MTTKKFSDLLKEDLADPNFKKAYAQEMGKLDSAVEFQRARLSAGLTQGDLAAKAGLAQATVVRIERGDNTSFASLSKFALALGKTLKVKFI